MKIKKIFVLFLAALFTFTVFMGDSFAAKRKKAGKKEAPLVTIEIPAAVTDALKNGDVEAAARGIHLHATSPRSEYLFKQMLTIVEYDADKRKAGRKDQLRTLNTGVAYHNLFLFLKGGGCQSKEFFKKASKFYTMSLKNKSPYRKNIVYMLLASLNASYGNAKLSEKYFKKTDPNLFEDELRKLLTLALYHSSVSDAAGAILDLDAAYKINPEYVKFWIGVSDDFVEVGNTPEFQEAIKKWKAFRRDKGKKPITVE